MSQRSEPRHVPGAKCPRPLSIFSPLRLAPVRAIVGVVVFSGGTLSMRAADAPAIAPPRLLTNVAQIRALSVEAAQAGYPVRLQGIATFSDPGRFLLCLQDSTAGIFVEPGARAPEVKSGQRIEVQGRTDAGDFGRIVKNPEIRVLGPGEYPAGVRGTYGRLSSGQEHGQWVRVGGTVRRAYADTRGDLHLQLVTGGRRIKAVVDESGSTNLTSLIGAEVSVSGVCAMVCAEDPGQLAKFHVLV